MIALRHIFVAALAALALGTSALVGGCQPQPQQGSTLSDRAPVELTASVDTISPKVGDTLVYRLSLDHAEGLDLAVPDVGTRMRGLSITDIEEQAPEQRDGRTIQSRIYRLRADLPGSYQIPEVRINYPDDDGGEAWAIAPAIFVEVASAGEAAEGPVLRDIKAPLAPPPKEFPWQASLAITAAAIALAAYRYWRKRQKVVEPMVPPPPPWVRALAELSDLEQQGLIERGDYRAYFFELSEIFRRYMELRFMVPALEQTTEEVLQLFRRGNQHAERVPKQQEDRVRQFLVGTDRVKFAKHEPSQGDVDALREACRAFISETTPRAPIEPTGGEAQS